MTACLVSKSILRCHSIDNVTNVSHLACEECASNIDGNNVTSKRVKVNNTVPLFIVS